MAEVIESPRRGQRVSLSVLTATERETVGGFSEPGKMPWLSYSIPVDRCGVGSRLRDVPGSVCHGCYAMKNRYRMPNVRDAMERRFEFLADLDSWKVEMTARINARFAHLSPVDRGRLAFFRWHDSGDLQSVPHLAAIVWVARHTPRVRHWLPTREYAIVREFLANGLTFPKNLTVRLSAHMVNGPTPDGYGLPVSSVHSEPGRYSTAHSCPADSQGGRCGACRACWSPEVEHVSYPRH